MNKNTETLARRRRWRRSWVWGACVTVFVSAAACGEPTATTGPSHVVPSDSSDGVGLPEAVVDPGVGFEVPEAVMDPGVGVDPEVVVDPGVGLPEAVVAPGVGVDPEVVVDPSDGDEDAGAQGGGDLSESGVEVSQPADAEAVSGPVDEGPVDLPGPLRFESEQYGQASFDLGFSGWPDQYTLEEYKDEVVVRLDSVLVRDGVVRGLVQNMSERLFARDVIVSAGGGQWLFPLTVQPTEVVPFTIEGYQGPADPELIDFDVTAEVRPDPDPRRSFHISGTPGIWSGTWDLLQHIFPNYGNDRPPDGTSEDQRVPYYRTLIELWAATSHPSIADHVKTQTIEDLRVYLTKMDDDGRVLDIREMVPYLWTTVGLSDDGSEIWGWPQVHSLPFVDPYRPDDPGYNIPVMVGFMPGAAQFAFTVGGAYDVGAG